MAHVTVWTSPTSRNYCYYTTLLKSKHRKCIKKIAPDVSKLHQSELRSSCALNLLIWNVIQQCVYETKIHDIDDLQKSLMETWFDFNQDIIDAAIDQWCDHLRSCVCMCVCVCVCVLCVGTLCWCGDSPAEVSGPMICRHQLAPGEFSSPEAKQ